MIQHLPWYIYNDRFTLSWEIYPDSDFLRYEVYVGAEAFTPSPVSLYATITDPATNHLEVTGRTAKTNYEVIVRLVTIGGSEDSRRYHVSTVDANAGVVFQDKDSFYWQNPCIVVGDNVILRALGIGNDTVGARTYSDYQVRSRSQGNVPFFTTQLVPKSGLYDYPPGHGLQPSDQSRPFGFSGSFYFDSEGVPLSSGDHEISIYGTTALDADGESWAPATKINPISDDSRIFKAIQYGKPVELSDGSFISSFFAINLAGNVFNNGVMRSVDNGVTWSFLAWTCQGNVAGGFPRPNEMSIVKISGAYPNERIIGVMRIMDNIMAGWNYDGDEPVLDTSSYSPHYWTESSDSGQTWTTPVPTNLGYPGWSPPTLHYDASVGRLYFAGAKRVFMGPTTSAANWNNPANWIDMGHFLRWSDALTPTGFYDDSVRINTQTDQGGNVGYCDIIDKGETLWITYPECVGQDKPNCGGRSNPFVAFKIIDKATLTIQPLPKYNYEGSPDDNPSGFHPRRIRGAHVHGATVKTQ